LKLLKFQRFFFFILPFFLNQLPFKTTKKSFLVFPNYFFIISSTN